MCGFFCVALAWIGDGWVAFQLMPKRLQILPPHCRESPENKNIQFYFLFADFYKKRFLKTFSLKLSKPESH
jgi:hypothetical protein